MEIICLPVGDLTTNCYLITDEATQKTIIVDPGDEGDFISTTILEKRLIPQAIILTHGHYDHCLAVLELKLNFNIPICLHPNDFFLYEKANLSAKHFSHISIPKLPKIDKSLNDQEIITFGESHLQIFHTPGHTPGSCCFVSHPTANSIFTGDTLFATGVGSADHSYSSKADLQKSLKKISAICNLRSDTSIYPGHEETGVLTERDSLQSLL